ncbi:rhodanese-like domain-containing protein [Methyloparacoccus murrellii]
MRQISPAELDTLLKSADDAPMLLDVREPHEFAHCRIDGSINIPMNSVPSRLSELDAAAEIVTVCHHGMRSQAVAQFLESQGYTRITNLQGGIDAWAQTIDPAMPRY